MVDMSDAERVKGRNGNEYLQKKVTTIEVPEEYKGKFLMLDSRTGDVFYKEAVKLSEEEKARRKQERKKKAEERRQNKVAERKKYNDEIEKLRVKLSTLRQDIKKKGAKLEDVSGDIAKAKEIQNKIEELREKRPVVPPTSKKKQ